MRSSRLAGVVLCAFLAGTARSAPDVGGPPTRKDLTELSLSELAEVEVISASKKPERILRIPSAVYVITREDIDRSGARSIPEALRLAPGLQVARISSNQWAIGVRGFGSRLSRSVLVLIDGRSVYTPLFGGVYWETQDTLLEDIERIEVIRGPGGAIWGANAVNGVINIITRSASETLGGYARAGGGTEERKFASARYGRSVGDGKATGLGDAAFRVYGKYFDRGPEFHESGPPYDSWQMTQGGFRADLAGAPAMPLSLSLQGDVYSGKAGQTATLGRYRPASFQTIYQDANLSGGNLLAKAERGLPGGATLSGHVYYDRTTRTEVSFSEARDTFDGEVRYAGHLPFGQELVGGTGYRVSTGRGNGVETIVFDPPTKRDTIFNVFFQDRIALSKRFAVIVGMKLEHNDTSGWETQPDLRLLATPSETQAFWLAVSRAVRAPSRIDADLSLTAFVSTTGPTFFRVLGNDDFRAEKVTAYEAGWRVQPTPTLWIDTAVFYNRYTDLLSLEPGASFVEGTPPRVILPFLEANGLQGNVWGGEVSAEARLTPYWRLSGSWSYLRMDLHPRPGSHDTTQSAAEKASPQNQLGFHSSFNLPAHTGLDVLFRWVDELPSQQIPSYSGLDLRASWSPIERLELTVVGQNLLQPHHGEFGTPASRVEIRRGVYGSAVYRW